jgi:hypothetical protein
MVYTDFMHASSQKVLLTAPVDFGIFAFSNLTIAVLKTITAFV